MKKIIALCFYFIILFYASMAWAIDVRFQWGESTGQVDGYRIYWGDTQAGPYPNLLCEVDEKTLNCIAPLNESQQYYLVCRAFNNYGESGDSNEVHWCYSVPGVPQSLQWSVDLIALMRGLGVDQIRFVSTD